jgi:hypothetical protein
MSILQYNTHQIPTYKRSECASFVLRTSDATVSDANLTTHTWRNIDLRTLIGSEMYDRYDTFMLKPVCIATANPPTLTAGILPDDRMLVFNIQGLPFTNYLNSTTLTKLQSCVFGTLVLRVTYMTATNGGIPLTFGKYKELTDLTIFYNRVNKTGNSYQIQTNNPYPHLVFSFQIYGINK